MTPNEKVAEQYDKFLLDLPALKATYGGRWIVYLDGVQSVHDTERGALKAAVEAFGFDGGFTVVQVVDQEPVLLTAALAFGR